MIVIERDGFGVKLVDVRRLGVGVAVASEIAVALVIRDDEDDVRWGCGQARNPETGAEDESEDESSHDVEGLVTESKRRCLAESWHGGVGSQE